MLECIDRMYLNVYVPLLQAGAGLAVLLPEAARPAGAVVGAIKRYAARNGINVVTFRSATMAR